jgi:hypothetical protein
MFGTFENLAIADISIDEAVAELQAGYMIEIVDGEDRENEDDVMNAVERVTAEAIVPSSLSDELWAELEPIELEKAL